MKKSEKNKGGKGKQSPQQAKAPAEGSELLKWTVTPFREEPKKGVVFGLSCLLFLALLYILYREIIWVVLAVGVLTAAYSQYIFPSHYRLTTAGVEVRSLFSKTSRAWSQYTSVRKHKDGVFLVYGVGKQSRLGHFLYFGDQKPEAVLAVIAKFIA